MKDQMKMFEYDERTNREVEAVARSTDPETSWEAARTVRVRESQQIVLRYIRSYGPVHDERLIQLMNHDNVKMTDSGIRTRRSELVRAGLVEDAGFVTFTRAMRRTSLWAAVRKDT